MTNSWLHIFLAISLIGLFGFLSSLIVLESYETPFKEQRVQKIVSLNDNAQKTYTIEPKIKVDYNKDSDKEIGVLLKVDEKNLDRAARTVSKSRKHKVGNVIAANVPQNIIDELAGNDIIEQILPNRIVTAFEIDEVYETNADVFWNSGYTGKGTVVAVLDTGVNSANVVAAKDFTGSGTVNDENSHGTKVARIISAVAPDVKFINAKVLDKEGLGSEASVIAGINYAVEKNADVISLSLGGLFEDFNSPLVSAVEEAVQKGIVVVAAAGNCMINCNDFTGVATPGIAPNIITVGSVDGNNQVISSSGKDFGNYIKPDLVAPVSANSLTGTSASAPFVSGAAALLLQKYNANPYQIKSLLESNALDLGVSGKDIIFGAGKLNLNLETEELEENIVEFENEEREIIDEPVILAFEAPILNNEHPTWNVLDAWATTTTIIAGETIYGFDVLNDDFIIMAGRRDQGRSENSSSVLIWNGTEWFGNNNTDMVLDYGEFMHTVDIYDRDFAVIGGYGANETNIYALVYVWDSGILTPYVLGDGAVFGGSTILDVWVNSPTDAYALEATGEIYRFNGTDWNPLSVELDGLYYDQNLSFSVLSENDIILLYGRTYLNASVNYFDGISWTTNKLSFNHNCSNMQDIEFVKPGVAYAACDNSIVKLTGSDLETVYNFTVPGGKIKGLSFVNENFGFATASNATMLRWDGFEWTAKTYTGETYFGYDTSGCGNDTFDFIKIHMKDKNEGYASAICFPYMLDFKGIINSNWIWDGSDWKMDAVNVTTPRPAGTVSNPYSPEGLGDTLRLSLWKFAEAGDDLYAFGYDDLGIYSPWYESYHSRIGPNSLLLKLKKPLSMYVPGISIAVNGTKSVNLSNYTKSDKNVSYTVYEEDTLEVNCAIVDTVLTVTGYTDFEGIGICKIKAETVENSIIKDVYIYVGVIPAELDVYVGTDDIMFDATGDPVVEIHSVSGDTARDINVTLVELNKGTIVDEQIFNILSFDTKDEVTVFTETFPVARGNDLVVVVDSGNVLYEVTKTNNRARKKYKMADVFINLSVEPVFKSVFEDYLKKEIAGYNIVSSLPADKVINIGYNLGNKKIGCSNGIVYNNGETEDRVHTGAIFTTGYVTNVCGARIEGLVNAVRSMNKIELNNNKDIVFTEDDNSAIATRDFMNNYATITPEIIEKALYGGLAVNEQIVRDVDGKYLRMRNYKPIVSQSFLDYLFGLDSSKPWLEPVVMAGGLWSDISAWEEAGREIAIGKQDNYIGRDPIEYSPRDVWLIELTGGPGTECSYCTDYTYDDVVDKHLSVSLGAVLQLTGKGEVAYVGHSNGGRAALDFMSNWNSLKGTNVGTLSDGTPIFLPNTAEHPITNYIGVGVPGNFSNPTPFTIAVDGGTGDNVINEFYEEGKEHVKLPEFAARLPGFVAYVAKELTEKNKNKISIALLKKYVYFANNTEDSQPGKGVAIEKATIIYGNSGVADDKSSDLIIPVSDAKGIYNEISSSDKKLFSYATYHIFQTTAMAIKTKIKERLN